MKKSKRIEKLINDILQLYWEYGYSVDEISIPIEWKKELDKTVNKHKFKDSISLLDSNYGTLLLFETQARNLLITVKPGRGLNGK